MKKERRYWRIQGFNSDKLIYERIIPSHLASKKCMMELLKRLASMHLSENYIIAGSRNGHYRMKSALFSLKFHHHKPGLRAIQSLSAKASTI